MSRILFVTGHCPYGPSYGGMLRTLHIARILRRCGELGMVLMPFRAIDATMLQKVRDEFDLRAVLHLDKRTSRAISSRWKREIDPYSANTQGYTLGDEGSVIMDEIVKDYDLIWFHGITIPNSLGRRSWPCSILDVDDIKSQVYTGLAKGSGKWLSRVKAVRQAILWRRRERVLLDRFGILNVCCETDKLSLGDDARIHTIPNGFEAPTEEPLRLPASPPRIGFIGTLEYPPNVDGLRWFIKQVWPLIKAVRKDVRLRLVGLDTDAGISGEGSDIDGLGFVEDVSTEIAGWATSIVPINVGGGTRIKIAEAFSRKCPVVSTSLGAYGYQLESGRECLLADTPSDIANACLRLLDDRVYGDELAQRAWQRFCTEWSWEAIAPNVIAAVDACLTRIGGNNVID